MFQLSKVFPLPYYAVIFISEKESEDTAFDEVGKRIVELASTQPGLLGMDRYRSPDGLGFSISYWGSMESIKRWREQEEHVFAQDQSREEWYSQYSIRTCKVEYDYFWRR
ncbi:MAG: antibiotic biosynthesis monooxygenase family protein [Thermoguttaceae bacterium]